TSSPYTRPADQGIAIDYSRPVCGTIDASSAARRGREAEPRAAAGANPRARRRRELRRYPDGGRHLSGEAAFPFYPGARSRRRDRPRNVSRRALLRDIAACEIVRSSDVTAPESAAVLGRRHGAAL